MLNATSFFDLLFFFFVFSTLFHQKKKKNSTQNLSTFDESFILCIHYLVGGGCETNHLHLNPILYSRNYTKPNKELVAE
jgi:hypothetical protein